MVFVSFEAWAPAAAEVAEAGMLIFSLLEVVGGSFFSRLAPLLDVRTEKDFLAFSACLFRLVRDEFFKRLDREAYSSLIEWKSLEFLVGYGM